MLYWGLNGRKRFFVCLLLLEFFSIQTQAQQLNLKGFLFSIDNSQPIPLANILNKTTRERFISNREGFFKLNCTQSDSIIFTAIGYDSLLLVANDILPGNMDDSINLFMKPTSYQLDDVTILSGDKRRDSILRAAANYLANDPLLNNYERALGPHAPKTQNQLTAMWNEYSKGGKDLKTFADFYYHTQMLKQVNLRYNKRIIKRSTGIEDQYLNEYIVFCNLNFHFILNASDYELILAMRKCADQFKAKKGID
jgi:hypothetical protein